MSAPLTKRRHFTMELVWTCGMDNQTCVLNPYRFQSRHNPGMANSITVHEWEIRWTQLAKDKPTEHGHHNHAISWKLNHQPTDHDPDPRDHRLTMTKHIQSSWPEAGESIQFQLPLGRKIHALQWLLHTISWRTSKSWKALLVDIVEAISNHNWNCVS